jgi:putative peptide zinc metalloprotease protein
MKLLRKNLIGATASESSGAYYLEEPTTGERFEFDEREYYLVNALREPYNDAVLLARFNAQFNAGMSLAELRTFVKRLEDLGLLGDEGARSAGSASVQELTKQPQKSRPVPGTDESAGENKEKKENNESATVTPLFQQQHTVVPSAGGDAPSARKPASDGDAASKPAIDPGAAGQTPAQEEPEKPSGREYAKEKFPGLYYLFCPERLLDGAINWFGFVRHMQKVLPYLIALGFFGLVFNFNDFRGDFVFSRIDYNVFKHLVFTFFTINLGSNVLKGLMGRYHGIPTPAFGIRMGFGLIPRFMLPVEVPQDASKEIKVTFTSAALLSRAWLFCFGMLVWMIFRGSGNELPTFGISLAFIAIVSGLFVANPLLDTDGAKLLALKLDQPDLRNKAFRALKFSTSKQPSVIAQYVDTATYLKVYALACVVFIVLLLGVVAWLVATWLENNYRGLGVAVFLLLACYQAMRQWRSKKKGGNKMNMANAKGKAAAGGGIDAVVENAVKPEKKPSLVARARARVREMGRVRPFVFLVLVICMFLPYSYESGGEALILPYALQELYPESQGRVENVYFDGGEFVEEGTIIAEMANHRQRKDVDVTRQEILKKGEELEVLLSTPSPEEIRAAEEQLKTAQLQLQFSVSEEARLAALVDDGYVSDTEHEKALEEMQVDEQRVIEKEAALSALKALINPNEIEALETEIGILRRNLEYYDEVLERTRLRMPFDGTIVTINLRDLENTYLDEGVMFAKVEDARRVKVDISIPEADAGEITLGNRVRLKLEAYPSRTIEGEVTLISPATEADQFGTILSVISVMDNDSQIMKSGMTGHAKILSREMFLIEAFTRSLIRFVRVEVWSWLP